MNYSPGTKYIHYYTGEIPEMVKFVFKSIPIANFADLSSGDGSLLYSLNTKGYFSKIKNIIAVDISQERINNVRKIGRLDRVLPVLRTSCSRLRVVGLRNSQPYYPEN